MDSGAGNERVEELLARVNGCHRDFLKRFGGHGCANGRPQGVRQNAAEEIELNLGLSLGGCFGVEPREKKLVRSSSIAAPSMVPRIYEREFSGLLRASSLPAENGEEVRKRKELQSLKRLEAKRKRTEKRNSRIEGLVEDMNGNQTKVNGLNGVHSNGFMGMKNGNGTNGWAMGGVGAVQSHRPVSQGSGGSQGSGSSGLSDSGSLTPAIGFEITRINGSSEDRNPSNGCSLLESANHKVSSTPQLPMLKGQNSGDLSKKMMAASINGRSARDIERTMMEEMPCVTTKGDGPNGRRIEGFLYRYRKGEEVRIVCVCHGSFLTPAEFVRHAGGGDVAHPLRHIVVNPSPAAFL
ncbi:putative ethylene-responsive binding factor-associated repression, Ninja family [Dioscorea sansibarensis]